MKKIAGVLLGVSFLMFNHKILNCKDKPISRAIFDQKGGYGKRYHFTIFDVSGNANPHKMQCTSYSYMTSEIYTDTLGKVSGIKVIWKNKFGGKDIQTQETMKNLTFLFGKEKLQIDGYKNEYNYLNIIYKIEKSSPQSWDIPIEIVQIQ